MYWLYNGTHLPPCKQGLLVQLFPSNLAVICLICVTKLFNLPRVLLIKSLRSANLVLFSMILILPSISVKDLDWSSWTTFWTFAKAFSSQFWLETLFEVLPAMISRKLSSPILKHERPFKLMVMFPLNPGCRIRFPFEDMIVGLQIILAMWKILWNYRISLRIDHIGTNKIHQ